MDLFAPRRIQHLLILTSVLSVGLCPVLSRAVSRDTDSIFLQSGPIDRTARQARALDANGGESPLAVGIDASLARMGIERADASYYLVRATGPRMAGIKSAIQARGGTIIDYVQYYTLIVHMDATTLQAVAKLHGVEWIDVYGPVHRLHARLKAARAGGAAPEADINQTLKVEILLFLSEPVADVSKVLVNGGATILATVDRPHLKKIRALIPEALLATLSETASVRLVYEYREPAVNNDVGTQIMGAPTLWNSHGLTGAGQIIGHADTGLDSGTMGAGMHPDFRGRIVAAYALGKTGDWSDFNGHGTHTAGSILGNGSAFGGQYKGTAYEAQLVHQALEDSSGGLGGIPADNGDLFEQAYGDGARIHSDSWGDSTPDGSYGSGNEIDTWTWNDGSPRDLLVVFSAGNGGPGANTVGWPGTAKNCLTVGASENDRPTLGTNADNTNEVADFSSRGPTDEGRIKPDVVAPGTWIASCRTHGSVDVYSTDFESGTQGWTEEAGGSVTPTDWHMSTADSRTPSTSWRHNGSGTLDDYLVSPAITLPADSGKFRARFFMKGDTDTALLGISVRNSGETSWTDYVFGARDYTSYNAFTLSTTASGDKDFAITLTSAASSSPDIFVDDFSVSTFSSWSDMWVEGLASRGDTEDTNYTLSGGTSMATPLVAGAAALVRQFYMQNKSHTPSAALLKATLINGAVDMTPATPRPDNDEGWGRVDLDYTLFPPAPRTMLFFDITNSVDEGEQELHAFDVTAGTEELKITLAWTDRQGATLQNDLDMEILSPTTTMSNSDNINNVEGIDITNPQTGHWAVRVSGTTVPYGPQPYAVVVSGAVAPSSAPAAPSGFKARALSTNEIHVGWALNPAGHVVMVAANTSNSFGTPVDGTSYTVGSSLGSATIIYKGTGTNTLHSGLETGVQYFYSAWSVDGSLNYSLSPSDSAFTLAGAGPFPFFDDFESGFSSSKWEVADATIDGVGINEPSPVSSARFNGYPDGSDELRSRSLDLHGVATPALEFSFQRTGGGNSTEVGDDLVVEYMTSGGTWAELDRHLGSGTDMTTFEKRIIALPADALHSSFQFRFVNSATASTTSLYDDWFVDDVAVYQPSLEITTDALPSGRVGDVYTASLEAIYGTPPYTWSISTGALQAGLHLSSDGQITGTPTTPGSNTLVFAVHDDVGATTNKTLSLVVQPRILSHFTWGAIASPQTSDTPFSVSITAKDQSGNTLETYAGWPSLKAWSTTSDSGTTNLLEDSTFTSQWSGSGRTRGIRFSLTNDITVTHVRHICGEFIAIWTDAGTLITNVPVSSTQGTWINTPLERPIPLYAGQTYRLSAFWANTSAYYGRPISTPVPFAHGMITDGCYTSSSTFGFPGSDSTVLYLVDLLYAGGSVSVIPASPSQVGPFLNGTWTGNVWIHATADNAFLTVERSPGTTDASANFVVHPLSGDTDGDRIDDTWELRFFSSLTNLSRGGDWDGDGAFDDEEYIADTLPHDSNSFLRVQGISNLPPVRVMFQSSSNREYRLLYTPSLVNGSWLPVPGYSPRRGTGGSDALFDTNSPQSGMHYRIQVELP